MRHQLSFWSDPWRPAQDWFDSGPVFRVWNDDDDRTYAHLPACEVEELKDHFLVTLDMPGVSKEDIRIETANGRLAVTAERKQEKHSGEKENRFSERRYGKFERIFELGDHVDPEKIEAQYEDGVLKISLAKAEAAKPRKVSVGSGGGFFRKLAGDKDSKPVRQVS